MLTCSTSLRTVAQHQLLARPLWHVKSAGWAGGRAAAVRQLHMQVSFTPVRPPLVTWPLPVAGRCGWPCVTHARGKLERPPYLGDMKTGSVQAMATTARASGRQPVRAAASRMAPCVGASGSRASCPPTSSVSRPCMHSPDRSHCVPGQCREQSMPFSEAHAVLQREDLAGARASGGNHQRGDGRPTC